MNRLRARLDSGGDAGFSLVELLVALTLFGVLGGTLMATVVATKASVAASRETHDLNEEARLAINRMSRELRQATEITAVSAPTTINSVARESGEVSVTFTVDFNGNGVIDASAVDPEVLTYKWDGSQVLLIANDTSGSPVIAPVLSGKVSDFSLDYFSSDYRRDCSPVDGMTNWRELDAYLTTKNASGVCDARPAAGHTVGAIDTSELTDIDSVTISFTVLEGTRRQAYRTQVDLRNAR
jgi:prepilin-type N-terminal cleavage/methylation domain-containing protein